jgi:hypothetical protein
MVEFLRNELVSVALLPAITPPIIEPLPLELAP